MLKEEVILANNSYFGCVFGCHKCDQKPENWQQVGRRHNVNTLKLQIQSFTMIHGNLVCHLKIIWWPSEYVHVFE